MHACMLTHTYTHAHTRTDTGGHDEGARWPTWKCVHALVPAHIQARPTPLYIGTVQVRGAAPAGNCVHALVLAHFQAHQPPLSRCLVRCPCSTGRTRTLPLTSNRFRSTWAAGWSSSRGNLSIWYDEAAPSPSPPLRPHLPLPHLPLPHLPCPTSPRSSRGNSSIWYGGAAPSPSQSHHGRCTPASLRIFSYRSYRCFALWPLRRSSFFSLWV